MAQKITARIPTVQYGYLEVEADTQAEFADVFAYAEDVAARWMDADGQAAKTLAAGGIQTTPLAQSGPPPWAVTTRDEAQQFIPPAGPAQQPPSGWQSSVPQQQQASPAPGIQCAHGTRTTRTGNSAKGPWTGHFCPLPKGDPNQCKPIFA